MATDSGSEVSSGSSEPNLAESSNRKKKVAVNSDFYGGHSDSYDASDESMKGRLSKLVVKCFRSTSFANFIVIVVIVDAICTCRDIDARAQGVLTPTGFLVISNLCLAVYTLEFVLQIVVEGIPFSKTWKDWPLLLDLLVILCGISEIVVNAILPNDPLSGINVVRALRLGRILRLARFLRKLRPLKELQKLATMMSTCAKTLLWSFILCFMVMTVWSMLMVEAVNPLLQALQQETGTFDECGSRCQRSMSSVMEANLLLFQTVIAGDGWGEIAVPLIQAYPASAIIFMGSSLTLVFGVLNLIVAVVVDTFADARQNDVQNLAAEMEDEIQHDRKSLAKLFSRIDADGSGQVTLQELVEAARKDLDFQSRLRVMDIDENDLQMLFEMIDLDGSGAIEAQEFIGPLSRWAHDSKTAPRFIKYNLMQTMKIQEDLYDLCEDCFKHLALQIDKVFGEVRALKQSRPQAKSDQEDAINSELDKPALERQGLEGQHKDQVLINPSREIGKLLVEKGMENDSPRTSAHSAFLNASLEGAVADLQASLQRLEVFSLDANEMVKKWAELPVDLGRRRHNDPSSTGSNGSKADVFWAHYMDRERDTGAKRKTRLGPPTTRNFKTLAAVGASSGASSPAATPTAAVNRTSEFSQPSVIKIRSASDEVSQPSVIMIHSATDGSKEAQKDAKRADV